MKVGAANQGCAGHGVKAGVLYGAQRALPASTVEWLGQELVTAESVEGTIV